MHARTFPERLSKLESESVTVIEPDRPVSVSSDSHTPAPYNRATRQHRTGQRSVCCPRQTPRCRERGQGSCSSKRATTTGVGYSLFVHLIQNEMRGDSHISMRLEMYLSQNPPTFCWYRPSRRTRQTDKPAAPRDVVTPACVQARYSQGRSAKGPGVPLGSREFTASAITHQQSLLAEVGLGHGAAQLDRMK